MQSKKVAPIIKAKFAQTLVTLSLSITFITFISGNYPNAKCQSNFVHHHLATDLLTAKSDNYEAKQTVQNMCEAKKKVPRKITEVKIRHCLSHCSVGSQVKGNNK